MSRQVPLARALVALLLVFAGWGMTFQGLASAQTGGCGSKDNAQACGDASAAGFGVTLTDPSADAEAAPVAAGQGGGAAPRAAVVRELTYEPTCSLNTPENGGALCLGAVSICPTDGDIAYWVYVRSRNMRTGATTPWVRVLDPPNVCLGATDPPPPTVAIEVLIGQELAREFANLALPRAAVEVKPQGRTLINIPTRFYTSVGTTQLAPVTILGRQVTVTAIADRYDWSLSPTVAYSDAGPGSPADPVEHTYTAPGSVGPTVTVTWSGTFTVEGVAGLFPIIGTATTTGPPAALQVLESRSQLVEKS